MIRATLLTSPDCDLCEHAAEVLARLAPDFDLVVETVDITSDAGRRLGLAAGVLFPPGVLLDGRGFSYGRVSERRLRRELESRRDARGR